VFYRQGQTFSIKIDNIEDPYYDKMTEKDLGNMYMFNNECLMVSSSNILQFFVKEWDDVTEQRRWNFHHTINIRGFIFYNSATKRL
jgi:L-ribulose-5-phosphate 3-epimerase UlaE